MREIAFTRIIGIDYSGEGTPVDRLGRLAVYRVEDHGLPHRVLPRLEDGEGENTKNWTRKKIAHWLVEQLQEEDKPTLVGIDHAFSFPMRYFERYPQAQESWDSFLNDFRKYWPTCEDNAQVSATKMRSGKKRCGCSEWKRLTDESTPTAKSVFDFDAKQGNVAYSTHAGIPWLWYIREKLRVSKEQVQFWPFDCWKVCEGYSVVAEVYPALWKGLFGPRPADMTRDQYDAYIVAAWLSWASQKGLLGHYFSPDLCPKELTKAKTEGWILGSLGLNRLGVGKDVRACLSSTGLGARQG